jgi:import receptor subunit TOM20
VNDLCSPFCEGPDFAVEAALAFFRALRVYPSPVELIMIFQNTVPEPIFKVCVVAFTCFNSILKTSQMVLEMMRLDVSEPSPTKTDEAPPSALSEDDGSTSNRGPPSETSSQDWDQVTDPGSLTPPTA